jgi:hypothetical protein
VPALRQPALEQVDAEKDGPDVEAVCDEPPGTQPAVESGHQDEAPDRLRKRVDDHDEADLLRVEGEAAELDRSKEPKREEGGVGEAKDVDEGLDEEDAEDGGVDDLADGAPEVVVLLVRGLAQPDEAGDAARDGGDPREDAGQGEGEVAEELDGRETPVWLDEQPAHGGARHHGNVGSEREVGEGGGAVGGVGELCKERPDDDDATAEEAADGAEENHLEDGRGKAEEDGEQTTDAQEDGQGLTAAESVAQPGGGREGHDSSKREGGFDGADVEADVFDGDSACKDLPLDERQENGEVELPYGVGAVVIQYERRLTGSVKRSQLSKPIMGMSSGVMASSALAATSSSGCRSESGLPSAAIDANLVVEMQSTGLRSYRFPERGTSVDRNSLP